jgi:enoyl-CoA hydratase/carnithine racemase
MAAGQIRYEAREGAAWLVLDNPGRRNAMTQAMWAELPKRLAAAGADPSVRCIVLRGAGSEAFCAGADISEFGEKRIGDGVARYDRTVADAVAALVAATKPTIAVIEGFCFGGGMALAMCCDIRIASETAKFRIPAARLGLGYDFENIRLLTHKLGPDAVADILFTSRVLSASEATGYGIARVWPQAELESAARTIVGQIADNAPLTLRAIKRALIELGKPQDCQDKAAADAAVALCFASEDYREGRAAFAEKRPPRFRGC